MMILLNLNSQILSASITESLLAASFTPRRSPRRGLRTSEFAIRCVSLFTRYLAIFCPHPLATCRGTAPGPPLDQRKHRGLWWRQKQGHYLGREVSFVSQPGCCIRFPQFLLLQCWSCVCCHPTPRLSPRPAFRRLELSGEREQLQRDLGPVLDGEIVLDFPASQLAALGPAIRSRPASARR